MEESPSDPCTNPRSSQDTSSELDWSHHRKHRALFKPFGILQKTTRDLADTSHPGPPGDGCCQDSDARVEQRCSGDSGGGRCQCGTHARCGGGEAQSKTGENAEAMCELSGHPSFCRSHADRLFRQRGRGPHQRNRKTSSWPRSLVKLGSALVCLGQNITHVPHKRVTWSAELVEAYDSGWGWPEHAASHDVTKHSSFHSVVREGDFLSPWQAELKALSLHHEIEMEEFDAISLDFDLQMPQLMNRFSKNVQANYGLQPQEHWRLFPSLDWKERWLGNHPDDEHLLPQGHNDHEAARQRQPLHHFDPWVGELWLTLGRFGVVDRATHRFAVPVATWFLHFEHDRQCFRPRIFHFDDTYEMWNSDLRQLWADRIHQGQRLHFYYVTPAPPRSDDDSIAAGHLILAQHPQFERAVG